MPEEYSQASLKKLNSSVMEGGSFGSLPPVIDIAVCQVRHYDWPSVVTAHNGLHSAMVWSAFNQAHRKPGLCPLSQPSCLGVQALSTTTLTPPAELNGGSPVSAVAVPWTILGRKAIEIVFLCFYFFLSVSCNSNTCRILQGSLMFDSLRSAVAATTASWASKMVPYIASIFSPDSIEGLSQRLLRVSQTRTHLVSRPHPSLAMWTCDMMIHDVHRLSGSMMCINMHKLYNNIQTRQPTIEINKY